MEHKVIAVGSRDLIKAKKFVEETTRGQHGLKSYGTYEDVYADKVCMSHNCSQGPIFQSPIGCRHYLCWSVLCPYNY